MSATKGDLSARRLAQELMRELAAWHKAQMDECAAAAKADENAIVGMLLLLHEFSLTLAKQRDDPQAAGRSAQDLLRRSLALLAGAGYNMTDFTGQLLTDELRERITIEGYRRGDVEHDSVSETLTPEIDKGGKILRHGCVIGLTADAPAQ